VITFEERRAVLVIVASSPRDGKVGTDDARSEVGIEERVCALCPGPDEAVL
jgi:hypothetical protein